MPNIHTPLPETEQNIFRPIVLAVVRQVQKITDMKDAQILFPNGDNKVATVGGTIDSKNEGFVETSSKRHNEITVTDELDREETSATFINAREYPPIFLDEKLDLVMTPIYAKHNVVITFKYQCNSKTEAKRWLDLMRMRLSQVNEINVHSVEYHYNLHQKLMNVAQKVYELREKQAPYGQTFEQYLTQCSTQRLTVIGDLAGKNAILAVAERQTEIYGMFDFDVLPAKPEKENDSGSWVIGFDYKFNYDEPIGCNLKFPILVHNLPMPLEYVSFTSDETREAAKAPVSFSRSQAAMRIFRSDVQMDRMKSEDGVIRIPRFDDFIPKNYAHYTYGILLVNTGITPADKRTLQSLTDLGDIVLDEDLITFFKESEWPYLCKTGHSIYHLSLYQNGFLQNSNKITINSDLTISSLEDLDIRSRYHIRLSVVSDITYVDKAAIGRILLYPSLLYKTTAAINRGFRENPEMIRLSRLETMSIRDFIAIYPGIYNQDPRYYGPDGIGWGCGDALRDCGFDITTMRQLSNGNKRQRQTLILGILAYDKKAEELKTVNARNIRLDVNPT